MVLIKWCLLLEGIALWPVNAHLVMTSPEPYSIDTLNNSPLAADGSDFPCKLRDNAFRVPSEEAVYRAGDNHTMTFQGSATHGGGSCQVSLTSDREPTKNSEWMVIQSYEGGCPADVAGTLAGGPASDNSLQLLFTIPENIGPGKYTLAWTWFNRIGNREMYMNCAPITVTSDSSVQSFRDAENYSNIFPPMFIANINGCKTREGVDVRFPQPGSFVETKGQLKDLMGKNDPACTGIPTFGSFGVTKTTVPLATSDALEKNPSAPTSSAFTTARTSWCCCHTL
ncbi:hypothetical protein N7510_005207 [Penicillium lagena]|uniref:uncharacterized protein n=1 Tax=Penicillium lagena TaxID=94218 RepID=UPI00253F74FF|nr:uncharacterized protein N7510_005207 [Penicillium lagena]KAJ5612013.1 hypothetical protein N7510_005207 [Penicillium lagena]